MTQRVGVHVTPGHAIIQDATHVARAQSGPTPIEEQGLGGRFAGHHVFARVLDPETNRLETSPVQGHEALLSSLAHHP